MWSYSRLGVKGHWIIKYDPPPSPIKCESLAFIKENYYIIKVSDKCHVYKM